MALAEVLAGMPGVEKVYPSDAKLFLLVKIAGARNVYSYFA